MPAPFSPGPGGPILVAAATPNAASAVDFSGLPVGDFTWWELIWQLGNSSGSDQLLNLQLNGDSTSGHYGYDLQDTSSGHVSNGSAAAAAIGYVVALSQAYGQGQCRFPASIRAGSTRSGTCSWSTNARSGAGGMIFSFSIALVATSIHLLSASGTISGDVRLYGVP